VIDTQTIATVAHKQSSSASIFNAGRAPTTSIADGGKYIRELELQVDSHGAAPRPVGMLDGVGTRFTDSDKQVSGHPRRRAHRGQPPAHGNPDIPHRPG
jgi:hypothetical protein